MDFEAASRLVNSPQASAQELADICNAFPELRAAAALHPNAHPELLNWLARLGDPEVNSALAARAARQQPAESGGGGKGWVWAIVVILLAVIGFFVWRMLNPADDDPEPAPTETEEATDEETDVPDDDPDEDTDEPTEDPTEMPDDALGTIAELFPDPAFAECVADSLGLGASTAVTQDQLDTIGEAFAQEQNTYYEDHGINIELSGGSLECSLGSPEEFNLEGVEHLRNLSSIEMGFEGTIASVDLAPLAELDGLQVVHTSTNDPEIKIELEAMESIEDIEGASLVRITQESYDELTGFDDLRFLAIFVSGVDDFDFLLDLPHLETLQIGQHSGDLPDDVHAELEARGVAIIEGQ